MHVWLLSTAFVLTVLTVSVRSQDDLCYGAALNGVLEIGCWGYKECIDNKIVTHLCPANEVFEKKSFSCVTPDQTADTECGKGAACVNKPDGAYPDIDCQSYYRCLKNKHVGRFYCSSELVFNAILGVCDWQQNVRAPCGTKIDIPPQKQQ